MRALLMLATLTILPGCGGCSNADTRERDAQEKLQAEAFRQVGVPNVTNFTEKKFLKQLYELRDQEGYQTWTYTVDLNNKRRLLCRSIGYGIPYSTQFSNPQKRDTAGSGGKPLVMTQGEPNGLFSPASADGTWIMAVTKDGVKPIYVEPKVIVSPFELETP